MAILNRPMPVMHIISGDLWAGAEVQAYNLLSQLKSTCLLMVVLFNDGELAHKLRQASIQTLIIPENQLSSPRIVLELIRIIRQFKPTVIHTHRQKENILGSLANVLAGFIRAKFATSIRTTHGAPEFLPKGKQRLQVIADNFVGHFFQKGIIAVSEDLANKLKQEYPIEKVFVIRNGISKAALLQEITTTDFKLAHPHAKHIGIIGRVEPVKRIDLFLQIAANILITADARKNYFFHVIGEGKLRLQMEQLATELGINSNVIFHGHRTDIPSCICDLDCIVMCSDHEGTPMLALEALCLERPMLVHATGGLNELFREQPEALVEIHKADEYARRLRLLLEKPVHPPSLAPEYTAEMNAQLTFDLYRRLSRN